MTKYEMACKLVNSRAWDGEKDPHVLAKEPKNFLQDMLDYMPDAEDEFDQYVEERHLALHADGYSDMEIE